MMLGIAVMYSVQSVAPLLQRRDGKVLSTRGKMKAKLAVLGEGLASKQTTLTIFVNCPNMCGQHQEWVLQ